MSQAAPVRPTGPTATGGYLRPTWRQAVAEYLPFRWRGHRADRWIDRLPIIAVLVVHAVMALRLGNTAYIDEARTINAGRDYLLHWFAGGPSIDHGALPVGVPTVYPVIAGLLDSLGGLWLVRLSSTLFMLVTIVVLKSAVARASSSGRIGVLAAAVFAFTAPVVFVGSLATSDALCLMLLALGARAAVTGRTPASAAAGGALLCLAAVVDYTAVLFVPVVLVLTAVVPGAEPAARRRHLAICAGVGLGLLAFAYAVLGAAVRAGVATALRSLATPVSGYGRGLLTAWAVLDLGTVVLLAVAGVVVLVRNRCGAPAWCLLIAGAALPLIQITAGAETGFDQHNAFAPLFLAVLAGHALAALSRRLFRLVPVAVILLVALLPGFSRSASMFHEWSDASVVLADVQMHPQPGRYLSVAADAFAYHSRDTAPGVAWEPTSALYAHGPVAVRDAVVHRHYQVVVLRSASTAGPDQDVLLAALRLSPDYEQDTLIQPVDGPSHDVWLVYRLVNELP